MLVVCYADGMVEDKNSNANRKDTTMETAITTQLERAAEIIGGVVSNRSDGLPRIAMTGFPGSKKQRERTAWFEFPDADGEHCGGARFVAGTSLRDYSLEALALCAFSADDEQLADDIMDCGEVPTSDPAFDEASHHLINGRCADARTALAEWL